MVLNFGKFPQKSEVLTNFDYVDIASGIGYETFYGGSTKISGAFTYRLSNLPFYSDQIASGATKVGAGYANGASYSFIVPFNYPRTIKGDMIVQVPLGVEGNAPGGNYKTLMKAYVSKWDGTTQTMINSGGSSAEIWTTYGFLSGYATSVLNIPTTKFKANEYLRIDIEQCIASVGTDTAYALIGMEPYGTRMGSGAFTWVAGENKLQIHIPFKLDL